MLLFGNPVAIIIYQGKHLVVVARADENGAIGSPGHRPGILHIVREDADLESFRHFDGAQARVFHLLQCRVDAGIVEQ